MAEVERGGAVPRSQLAVIRELIAAQAGREISSIAVVGNAPVSVSAERAERIDSCDVVVRMTTFEVDRELPRLGRKTNVVVLHRATGAGPSTWEGYRSRVYLVAEPGRRHYEPERRTPWWPADAAAVPVSNRDLVDPLNRQLGYASHHAVWVTTGTLAVGVLHSIFPEARILLAGSSLLESRPGRGRRLAHAWGPSVPVTPEHRLTTEARALKSWRSNGWLEVAARGEGVVA